MKPTPTGESMGAGWPLKYPDRKKRKAPFIQREVGVDRCWLSALFIASSLFTCGT